MSVVYLAEPIDFTDPGTPRPGDQVAPVLAQMGLSVYRPAMAWLGVDPTSEHGGALIEVNNSALDRSSLLVACLPSHIRSVGVPMEIERATSQGIPAVVITDITGSAMVNGNPLVVTVSPVVDGDKISQLMMRWAVEEAKRRARHVPPPTALRQLPVQVQEGHPGLVRHYSSDAGLDLFTTVDQTVEPGTTEFIACGVRVQLPSDTWALVTARSSAFEGYGVMIPPSVIDTGYRGEIGVPVYRLPGYRATGAEPNVIPKGSRLAQLVLLPNMTRTFSPVRVDQVEPADRGENGFGSTGR